MKKIVIILISLIIVILAAAITIPILYKDEIKAAIDAEIAKNVNADVYFDADKFSVSLFNNFPNLTVKLADFGIIGRDEFEGDVLLAVNSFQIEVNLKSLLFGDEIKINGLNLAGPSIFIKVLENGKANYDIAIQQDTVVEVTEEESGQSLAVNIDHWKITDADLVYEDLSIPFKMSLQGLNHEGGGEFRNNIFEMISNTTVENTTVSYDGDEYLTNKHLDAAVAMSMDLDQMKFIFGENDILVNDFALSFDGYFTMLETQYEMDINFKSPANDFKSLLSIIPGMYSSSFESIKTAGDLAFSGNVKGIYSDTQMPAYNVKLNVANAMFQYPDLSNPVSDINIDVSIANEDGDLEHTLIDLTKFEMVFGNNPVKATANIKGISSPTLKAKILADLDLGEISSSFPVDGFQMAGKFNLNLEADGKYDSLKGQFPNIQAGMTLNEGFFKYDAYPIPIEKANFVSKISNKGGTLEGTMVNVEQFNFEVDGESLSGYLVLNDLKNYQWDTRLKGKVNLDKISHILPLDSMVIAGIIAADISSKGNMKDLEAERYDKLTTSGELDVADFKFVSADLPQGMTISKASLSFNPKQIVLNSFDGQVGNSDMQLNGSISNYMEAMLSNKEIVTGNFEYKARKLDINEWMVEEEVNEDETVSYETELIEIPRNLNLRFVSNVEEVDYDNLKLKNLAGLILVKDGKVIMDNVGFNSLGGSFGLRGEYSTQDLEKPSFDFAVDVKNISIKEAYTSFNTIKVFAPIAEFLDGNFSTNFAFNGLLGEDMMPVLSSMSGQGLLNVAQAVLKENKITAGIASLTNLKDFKTNVLIKDLLLKTEIKDGKLNVKPFNIKLGNFNSLIEGSTGLDGTINYNLVLDVPAGSYGQQFNSFVNSFAGGNSEGQVSENIKLPISLTQTMLDPKISLGKGGTKDQVKNQLVSAAKENAIKQITENKGKIIKDSTVANLIDSSTINNTKAEITAKKDSVKKVLEAEAKLKEDSLKKVAEEAKKEVADKIKNVLKFKKSN